MSEYIIGTRGSLLALTQTTQIKNQLESLTGDQFTIKVIKTRGDLDTSRPLWQMEGKDFFTRELDDALLRKEIDLVVHSYKDLGSERPDGIKLGAVTKRYFGQDILLIKKSTIKKLPKMSKLNIGTSSPRRMTNLGACFFEFIPNGENIEITCSSLRGNVNTRIEKLLKGEHDAIVLALPGLERLATSEDSRKILSGLVEQLNFMILPESSFPSAVSQGALALECHAENIDLLEKLKLIEDKKTKDEMIRERQAFATYGGGCHLAVGINVKKQGPYYLHIHKGKTDNKNIDEKHLEGAFPKPDNQGPFFIGLSQKAIKKYTTQDQFTHDQFHKKTSCSSLEEIPKGAHYITSKHVLDSIFKFNSDDFIFSAGTKTSKELAKRGVWVNACADSLGDENLLPLKTSKALSLFYQQEGVNNWYTYSHNHAQSLIGEVIPCYERKMVTPTTLELESLKKINIFYWVSFSQYEEYCKVLPSIAQKFHCTGLGKTLTQFKEKEISVRPFIDIESFIDWTNSIQK